MTKFKNLGEIADHYLGRVDWSSVTPEYMHNLMVSACADALELQYDADQPKEHISFLQGKRVMLQQLIEEQSKTEKSLTQEIYGK